MTAPLIITVHGTPAPQGSKRGFYNPNLNRVQMVESSKKVKPWRQDVKHAALDTLGQLADDTAGLPWDYPLTGPVDLEIAFYLPRPKGHYGTGKNATRLKDSAPIFPTSKPDVDKLLRSTLDALKEAGVYGDDSQVSRLTGLKLYANARPPGAQIVVRRHKIIRDAIVRPRLVDTVDVQEALL